jgi:hypothetical protein
MEMQRKRTADAVSQMRERLSAMGILEKGKGVSGDPVSTSAAMSNSSPNRVPAKGTSDSQTSLDSVRSPSGKAIVPNKNPSDKSPPSSLSKAADIAPKDTEDDNDTASTVSATREVDAFELQEDFDVDKEEVEERTHQCALAMQ